MSVMIHPIGTPRYDCDPVNDAISYGTAVGWTTFFPGAGHHFTSAAAPGQNLYSSDAWDAD